MKKVLAIILALALTLGAVMLLASCGKNDNNEPTEAEVTEEITEAEGEEATGAEGEEATEAEEAAEAEVTEEATEAAAEETTAEEETTAAMPTETADIVAYYNDAVNGAFNAKAGFNKERYTDNEVMDAGVALKAFKSLVYKFVGIGAENKYTESVSKGAWESDARKNYLRKSTLTAGDVTGATCTDNGGKYTVVINVKPGNSVANESQKNTSAPVDKCGICVGNEDKGYYDHKTAEVIYDAIDDTYAGAKISENYSNARITAVIDSATGNLESLKVEFDMAVNIDISIGSATASGTTHIVYKDFKY